jgi:hypothetical protein
MEDFTSNQNDFDENRKEVTTGLELNFYTASKNLSRTNHFSFYECILDAKGVIHRKMISTVPDGFCYFLTLRAKDEHTLKSFESAVLNVFTLGQRFYTVDIKMEALDPWRQAQIRQSLDGNSEEYFWPINEKVLQLEVLPYTLLMKLGAPRQEAIAVARTQLEELRAAIKTEITKNGAF